MSTELLTLGLDIEALTQIVRRALEVVQPGERVLAIIPDKTRDDNTHLLFPIANEFLADRGVASFDALVAQGTHPPMSESQKRSKIGAADFSGHLYDHRWDEPDELITIGDLSAETVQQLTGGLISHAVPVSINKLLAPGIYDTVLVFGATVPHEVAGFAGGAKYFFPGVAGPELTHTTHWLGALAGIENIIGQVETPTRKLIEAAADFISARIISLNTVVSREADGELVTYALFTGEIRQAFRRAAEVSKQVHIRYTDRKYKRVIALLDPHYDELWVGGKASYKLGAIIEEGGELIIYAPHLTKLSETRENLCIAAHLAHVAYAGRLDDQGKVVPRYRITMATGLDEETCRRVNLGYIDHRTFDYEPDPDTLVVENAGRDLYQV
jgi:nickel-dependent lactate racemase